jgi:uncharacterized protein with von Willebrand factor type A (vWA) domain
VQADVAGRRVGLHYLSRAALVKDERNLDKFDRVFGHVFKGLELMQDADRRNPDGVAEEARRQHLTEEEKKQIEVVGGSTSCWDSGTHAEQKKRHQGGNKWIVPNALRRSATLGLQS